MEAVTEKKKLARVIDIFAEKMKEKLFKKADEGACGWDQPELEGVIHVMLQEHVKRQIESRKGQEVDIACLAMFIYFINNKISLHELLNDRRRVRKSKYPPCPVCGDKLPHYCGGDSWYCEHCDKIYTEEEGRAKEASKKASNKEKKRSKKSKTGKA